RRRHTRFSRDWSSDVCSSDLRTQLDEYSLRSHELSAAATDAGAFTGQIAPVGDFATDEGIRRGGTVESLAKLKTVFKEDGVIHAGNSSQISDGAGALLITTSEYAAAQGWTPLARIHTAVVAADDPVVMLTGPTPATEKALKRSGLSIDDIGAFEINEAFAPVPLAWQVETGAKPDRLNPLGGAIGVGHPLGGSGAILMTRLVHHMRDNGIRYGLQSMCEAGGMANATILELLCSRSFPKLLRIRRKHYGTQGSVRSHHRRSVRSRSRHGTSRPGGRWQRHPHRPPRLER